MKSKIQTIKTEVEKEIEKFFSEEDFRKKFLLDKVVDYQDFSDIFELIKYMLESGGKRWRAILVILSARALKNDFHFSQYKDRDDILFQLAAVVELIHTASLIHDDIEDSSETRRGKAAAHIKFGLDIALNSGSWLYFFPLQNLQQLNINSSLKELIIGFTIKAIYCLHLGQALDINWHRDATYFPPLEKYEEMIKLKTGTLAWLASCFGACIMEVEAVRRENFSMVMQELGIAFQILDDIKNITTGVVGKNKGDDIVEGKKSLPVIFHVQTNPNDKEKLTRLFEKSKIEGINSSAVEDAISLLNSSDCITRAKTYAKEKIASVKAELTKISYNEQGLKELLFFIDQLVPLD
ncbi:MAG: polyprenyl synthetase family protein [Treponemataceae bacterium]